MSAESGVPTFRGTGGIWETFRAQDLATPEAFERDPALVWRFYNYRREVMTTRKPNKVTRVNMCCNRHFSMHRVCHTPLARESNLHKP